MPLVTTDAVILQAFAYSDTSKILRLLTGTHGVRSAIAKGALRPRSRFGGILEPFTRGVATLYLKDGQDLHTLSGFEEARPRQELGRDLIRFGAACLIAEILIRTASEESDPALFDRVDGAFERLRHAEPSALESTALAEIWRLIGHLGFAPALDACLVCSRPVRPNAEVFFDYAAGGIHCPDCGGGGSGRTLSPHARASLEALQAGEAAVLANGAAAHWQFLARFLGYHVTDLGTLRSLRFLATQIEAS